MANTTTLDGNFISITFSGDSAWDLSSEFRDRSEWYIAGLKVASMTIIPSATDDAITIRNSKTANTTSAKVLQEISSSPYDIIRRPFFAEGQYLWPAIDASEVSAGVQMIIEVIV